MALQRVPAQMESSGSTVASRSWSSILDRQPCFSCFQLINEGLDGRELFRQVAEVGLQGVELLVQVIQSLRQRLDPGKKRKEIRKINSCKSVTTSKCNSPCFIAKPSRKFEHSAFPVAIMTQSVLK